MDAKNNENYILVLEDCTEVTQTNEVGKLSVITESDKQERKNKDCGTGGIHAVSPPCFRQQERNAQKLHEQLFDAIQRS